MRQPGEGGDGFYRVKDRLEFRAIVAQDKADAQGCEQDIHIKWSPYEKSIWRPNPSATYLAVYDKKTWNSDMPTTDISDLNVRNWIRFSNDASLEITAWRPRDPLRAKVEVGIDNPNDPKVFLKVKDREFFNQELGRYR